MWIFPKDLVCLNSSRSENLYYIFSNVSFLNFLFTLLWIVAICIFFNATLLLLLLLSRFSSVRLCATPETAAHQAPRPWDSPGKNTAVGCHFLLQCMKLKSESEVAQSCLTPSDPMDCSLPGSSVHGIFQARVLEWGAITFSECHPRSSFYFIE